MLKRIYPPITIILISIFAVIGCNKNKPYETVVAPAQAHFVGSKTQVYEILTNPAPAYNVVVGTTDVSSSDRTITYNVSSPSGAVAGTQYTLGTTGTVTIPAGQATANIDVHGIYNAYTSGRKDTIVFSLKEPSVKPAGFLDTVKLILRGPCFDGSVDQSSISQMSGNYTNTFENGSYGPYTTTISTITLTSATTGTATVNNLYDYFGPVTINFDWTDPNNTSVSIPLQITNQVYAPGQPFYVRTKPGASNKFSYCNNNLAFTLDVLVNISGTLYYYDNGVIYTMGR